jgi:hypothetical protein
MSFEWQEALFLSSIGSPISSKKSLLPVARAVHMSRVPQRDLLLCVYCIVSVTK